MSSKTHQKKSSPSIAAYIEAGADCIETASYQVSRMGYAEVGLSPDRADAALLRSVELARQAAAQVHSNATA
jgi:homocysteine S-methyltransferase